MPRFRRHSRYALIVPGNQPCIGEPLPNASLAVIPHQKLVDYVLDPTHHHGGPKAHVFAAALAIEHSDWRYLHDAILDELPNRPVTGAREPSRPRAVRTWEVRVLIEGLNDRAAWVITSWRMVDEHPVLVSARVAQKGRQDPRRGVR